jgi:hypothetical protein
MLAGHFTTETMMTNTLAIRAASLMLALSALAGTAVASPSLNWPGKSASIGGAIAARVIAVKCSGPLTPTEIAELDTYIDESQTKFMMESIANQRFSERVFPQVARDYDEAFSSKEACNYAARDMAKDMLKRVREAQAEAKKQAELKN